MFKDFGVDNGGHVGTAAGLATRGVGVVGAFSFAGSVVVDHRVHGAWRDAEEEAGGAEFFEVAEVVFPVGLWDYGDF